MSPIDSITREGSDVIIVASYGEHTVTRTFGVEEEVLLDVQVEGMCREAIALAKQNSEDLMEKLPAEIPIPKEFRSDTPQIEKG